MSDTVEVITNILECLNQAFTVASVVKETAIESYMSYAKSVGINTCRTFHNASNEIKTYQIQNRKKKHFCGLVPFDPDTFEMVE